MSLLLRTAVVVGLVCWSFFTLTAMVLELRAERRAARLDRHIDEAVAVTETPAEDRPDWGAR